MNDFLFLLLLAALACVLLAYYWQSQAGIGRGKVIQDDAGQQSSRVLSAPRYGLRGKPDYLLREGGALIPVEVKSGHAPQSGQPHQGHRLQLAAYFLLVEEALGETPPHGLLRYADRTFTIPNSASLRQQLLTQLTAMRHTQASGQARRNHQQAARCRHCSVAHACNQRLA